MDFAACDPRHRIVCATTPPSRARCCGDSFSHLCNSSPSIARFLPPLQQPPAPTAAGAARECGFRAWLPAPNFGAVGPQHQQAGGGFGPGQLQPQMDVNTYVQYAMLQQLQRMGRKKGTSDSDESRPGDDQPDRAPSKLRNVLRLRRRVRKRPLRIVTKY